MNSPSADPLWYKEAIIYQLHIKAFADSDGDGIGDFRGLIGKLDYLANLGVTALWLLPFYPSPLRDDGYDIADYTSVHPSYGTLDDFKEFLAEAHTRGLRVITELVLNHSSDQHPWFQRARKSPPGSPYRDYYVWSDTPDRYTDARIIFKDFEHSNWAWDPVAKAYFWHRFYSHQPDLNFDNPAVQKAMFGVLDFWFGLGVDGLRLDAVPYLYEREGTNGENLPETHDYLRKLRAHIDANYPNRMLLAEANQWPEDSVAYFGKGDECHMAFHFPLMPRLFMALQMEDRFPIIDILDQTPTIPDGCQWAMFLRNHDELTLEMVTDEERDYMYRMFAADPRARINLGIRRRLAPLLGNSRRKMELMNTLLFSMPGTPIIYYGDEIGMGDNIYLGDRNGVRTPMQWTGDRNAGFSRANPQQLYLPVVIDSEYHYEATNVENQEKNLSSPLWWMRRVVNMRKQFRAFGLGAVEFLFPDNPRVLAFLRKYEDEVILVLANLSRYTQPVEIDLSAYSGMTPMEVVSQNKFPTIKPTPYFFTLSPHGYYWLKLEPAAGDGHAERTATRPLVDSDPNWAALLSEPRKKAVEQRCLPSWMRGNRWFAGKARVIRSTKIQNAASLEGDESSVRLLFVEVTYLDGDPELYLVPLQISAGAVAHRLLEDAPQMVVARLNNEAVLHDALEDDAFRASLLRTIVRQEQTRVGAQVITGIRSPLLEAALSEKDLPNISSRLLRLEQSHTSIIYDNRFFLKLYRKLDSGINADAELIQLLTEKKKFENVPAFYGEIELCQPKAESRALALLVGHVPNEGDAWNYTLDAVGRYFDRVLERKPDSIQDAQLDEFLGGVYPDRARQLARRIGEMHLRLADEQEDANFVPEPFNGGYQRSLYQSMRSSTRRMIQLLQKRISTVPEARRDEVAALLKQEKAILDRQGKILAKIETSKIRIHGDLHLGQILNTGKDFVIIDFEGEPGRTLTERRMKRTPLRDVAGMLRSFHYAAFSSLWRQGTLRPEDVAFLEPWAEAWSQRISQIFLEEYLATTRGASFVPKDPAAVKTLMEVLLLEKAAYEIVYELNNRPDWVILPARGIHSILTSDSSA
jgi:maltose alpha-D-glucosyltransferase/alpha-amylase